MSTTSTSSKQNQTEHGNKNAWNYKKKDHQKSLRSHEITIYQTNNMFHDMVDLQKVSNNISYTVFHNIFIILIAKK